MFIGYMRNIKQKSGYSKKIAGKNNLK